MGNWLEGKYIDMLSSSLYNFKKTPSYWNFSCPVCDEFHTSSSKRKRRGYILDGGDHFYYYCHRCGASMTAEQFIRERDQNLFKEFRREKLQERGRPAPNNVVVFPKTNLQEILEDPLRKASKVVNLPEDHFARSYLEQRKIPEDRWEEFYFTQNFVRWVRSFHPSKFSEEALHFDEPRLIIPFRTPKGTMHAFQGRSFKKDSQAKYITIVMDEKIPCVYGLHKYHAIDEAFVTEGPIDSMFLTNGLASAGGDIVSKLIKFPKDRLTIVYDNERRSEPTLRKMEKAIKVGFKIVVWPDNMKWKDVNEMVLSGYEAREIEQIVRDNTYSGMKAEVALARWRRI